MIITYAMIRAKMTQPYARSLTGDAAKVVEEVVNQGIDAHLEACFCPDRGDKYEQVEQGGECALNCIVSPASLPVLLRRLDYMGVNDDDPIKADEATELCTEILEDLGVCVGGEIYQVVSPADEGEEEEEGDGEDG